MPDLASHLLVQTILDRIPPFRKYAPFTLLGAAAPDLAKGLIRWVSPTQAWWFYPFHSPLYMLIACYALSLLFQAEERGLVVWGGFIGVLIHIGLDVLQINYVSYYMPFFPFSFRSVALNVFSTEASLKWLLILPAIAVTAFVCDKKVMSRRG